MNDTIRKSRNPLVAAILSLCCTGLGHLYCGRVGRGLVFFSVSLLLAPVIALLMLLPASGAVLLLICASIGMAPLISLAAVIDAILVAAREGAEYRLHDYNRPVIYLLLILVGLVFPMGSMIYLRQNVAQAFKLPTGSMSPTAIPGDRILVDKMAPGGGAPERFDIVVFRYPIDRNKNYIKRVIGLPGDRVALIDGEVILNGSKLTLETEGDGTRTEGSEERTYRIEVGPEGKDLPEEEVPPATCFVLGDNRINSRDSRHFGFVPLGDIIGTARYRFWPPSRAGTIE